MMRDGVCRVFVVQELFSDGPAYRVAVVQFADGRPAESVKIGPASTSEVQ